MSGASLPARLEAHWLERSWTRPGDAVLVACSGGLDSLVLLHLVRFSLPALRLEVAAAHFDHRMRSEGPSEAAWLEGVTGAWRIPFHQAAADEVPRDEGRARELRYAFLERLLRDEGAAWILTAHHADDQIETVLFRILRGTGVEGLRGIPEVRDPGVLRPLLPFQRADLEAYARLHHIRPREDPTNRALRFARNRIRHQLLPLLAEIHPGARSGLLRLASHAAEAARTMDALLAPLLKEVVLEEGGDRLVLARDRILATAQPVQAEILRRSAVLLGVRLSAAGTAAALQFITTGSSGSGLSLAGGLRLSRDFDRLVLAGRSAVGREVSALPEGKGRCLLRIPSPEAGAGEFFLAGRRYRVRWGPDPRAGGPPPNGDASRAGGEPGEDDRWHWARFRAGELDFPLCFRRWVAGDRTRTPGGGRKLKKLFAELEIPAGERGRLPLLVDAEGLVVWIPGEHRAFLPPAGPGGAHGEFPTGTSKPDWRVGVSDAGH